MNKAVAMAAILALFAMNASVFAETIYNHHGEKTGKIERNGNSTTYYDEYNRTKTTVKSNGSGQAQIYNKFGESEGRYETNYAKGTRTFYDKYGAKAGMQKISPDGKTVTLYDKFGTRQGSVKHNDDGTYTRYDRHGKLVETYK